MKTTQTVFKDTLTKLKSKSKSKSNDKTLQKIYTPQKNKIHLDVNPKTNPKKTKPNSRVDNYDSKEKKQCQRYGSTSKSKSKDKNDRIGSKKIIITSPYLPKQNSKKQIATSLQKYKILKEELQKCKIKIENKLFLQARKILKKLNTTYTQNFQILYYLGYLSQLENDTQQAKRFYKICIKLSKNEGYFSQKDKKSQQKRQKLEKLARCNYYLNIFQACVQICTKLITQQKKPYFYQLKGKALLNLRKYGPAIDSFTNAIALDKNNISLYQYQGDCYKGIQAYQLALNCYNKYSQNLKCQNISILEKRASCFKFLGNKKKQDQMHEKIKRLKQQQIHNMGIMGIVEPVKNNKNIEQDVIPVSFGLFPPLLRPTSASLSEAQEVYQKGDIKLSLEIVKRIIQKQGANVRNLHWSALMHFQLEDYVECQKRIEEAVKLLSNPILPLVTFILPDSTDNTMLQSLKAIRNKLKQLNAYSLTEEQDKLIIQRRKKCLQQALNVFKNHQSSESQKDSKILNSKLTMIMQQSSIRSSRLFDSEQNSIFLLRYIRKVLKNWCQNNFSLQSLEQTTDLAFSLVKIRYKQFSILPMHIIYYTFRQQNLNKTFFQINQQLSVVLSKMCKKYPPSQTQISNSQIGLFQINWQNKPKINLFSTALAGGRPKFNSFKQLSKAIQLVAARAAQQFPKMNQICRSICLDKYNGFGYKIGLKVDKNNDMVQERVLSRIIQKMLSKQIKERAKNFFDDISVKQNKKLSEYLTDIQKQWEQTIDQIIADKNMKNQQIICAIYDFLRAKCMFTSVREIKQVTVQFIKAHANGQIYLLQIDDRLMSKTRDVVLKFKVKDIVGQLQLALQFQSVQNQFNHGLYELFRSPFGPFFASIMWFSGFALKKNQIFFKQKIKWSLNGLQYLRKYIYQEQLPIILNNQNNQSIELILTQFQVSLDSICCHLSTNTHLFLQYDQKTNKLQESIDKPKQKYIIKLFKDNFIIQQQNKYWIKLRIESTQTFFCLDKNQLKPISLQNSITAQPLIMKINKKKLDLNRKINSNNNYDSIKTIKQDYKNQYGYEQEIDQCRKWQKKICQMLDKNH